MAAYDPEIFGAPPQKDAGYDPEIFAAPKKSEEKIPMKAYKGSGSDLIDGGNAVGTGYFKNMTALAGLPVDTIANIIDLGKAAIGAPYTAITGKPAPEMLQIGDRSKVTGSGANILANVRKTTPGQVLTEAINPEYEGGYLQGAGGAMNGVIRPSSLLQAGNQALNSVAGLTFGKAVGDATGNQALATAASMSPTAVQNLAISGTKYAIRGGEAGRKNMEQRIQDLKAAGVNNPTMGLASGNSLIGGVENLLQSTPGAVNVMRKAREDAVNGLQAKANTAAATASPNRGTLESGVAIQSGIRDFKDQFKTTQTGLYDKLDKFIPGQTPVNVAGTKNTLSAINSDIPGAPELSKQFKNARITAIEDAIRSDTAGAPSTVMVYSRPPVGGGGLMNAPVEQPPRLVTVPEYPSRNTLPFEAVKKTRTLVGNEIADNSLLANVPLSKWKPLYGALSEDMGNAARAAGPEATGAFNRANQYTRAGMGRLDRVAPFADKVAPEQAAQLLERTMGDNVSTLQAVKKTLPEGARGTIAGTVIEKLGTARPGAQNEAGTAWSPETFLTNWNKMKPEARTELLSGFKNSAQVAADISAVAKATSMMRDSSKMWANPSGTASNLAARGVLGAIGAGGLAAGAGLLNPVVPLSAAGGLLGSYGLAKALTNGGNVNSAAQRTYIDPAMVNAQFSSLMGGGLLNQR